MNVWAGIVTYNPNIDRLIENINSIYDQVSKVVIFDNGSNNIAEISTSIRGYKELLLIPCEENRGLAYALNVICKKAVEFFVDWILLLDQDSVSEKNCINHFSEYFKLEKAAILCPVMFDSRRRVCTPQKKSGYTEIEECIQSGAVYNVQVLKEVDFFDEWYFIDYIDFDYCISVRRKGYKIYRINSLLLDQEASTIEPVLYHDFFMKLAKKMNSDFWAKLSYRPIIKPWRSYYTARNRIYYIYKNRDMLNAPLELIKSFFINIRNIIRIRDHIGTAVSIRKGVSEGRKKVREMKKQ